MKYSSLYSRNIFIVVLIVVLLKLSITTLLANSNSINRKYFVGLPKIYSRLDKQKILASQHICKSMNMIIGIKLKIHEYNFTKTNIWNNGRISKFNDSLLLLKASPNLRTYLFFNKNKIIDVDIYINSSKNLSTIISYGQINSISESKVSLHMNVSHIVDILKIEGTTFITLSHNPNPDLVLNQLSLSSNSINVIKKKFPKLDGSGINVSLKEDLYDKNDLDLLGAHFDTYNISNIISQHSTIMATIIGGRGLSYSNGNGVATGSRITSTNFNNLFPDNIDSLKKYSLFLQNHSYGSFIENYYGPEAAAYDKQIYDNDNMVHVMSSGNLGNTSSKQGYYKEIKGYSNLSGNFKHAKNVLVVGACNEYGNLLTFSSCGPAFDGRIKPEIVANSNNGTSEAAAITTGVIALLQQCYSQKYNVMPSSALIKAVLINSADDVGNVHLDHKSGYGSINASEALETILEHRFECSNISESEEYSINLDMPSDIKDFKVSLAWNDNESIINQTTRLSNNLDLSVIDPKGNVILPWTLNIFPAKDSLNMIAIRSKDSLNNLEQVTIDSPVVGKYKIIVHGTYVKSDSVKFHICYQTNSNNNFEWKYPLKDDELDGSRNNTIRWKNSFKDSLGHLSLSYDNGISWTFIDTIDLNKMYYVWNTPYVFKKGLLKITTKSNTFISFSFIISVPVSIKLAYKCADSVSLCWKPIFPNMLYKVYAIINNKFLEINSTSDTIVTIKDILKNSNLFAISCKSYDNLEGMKSVTINLRDYQNDCFVNNFNADFINDNQIQLRLNLVSNIGIDFIIWEKIMENGQFTPIGTTVVTSELSYSMLDTNLKSVINTYRVKLITKNRKTIFSNIVSKEYLKQGSDFSLFPTPFENYMWCVSKENKDFQLLLYNSIGQLLKNVKLVNLKQEVKLSDLSTGLYIIFILANNRDILFSTKVQKF